MTRPTPTPGGPAASPPTCYRHPDRPTYVSCVRCGRPICPEDMRPASVGFQCPEEDSAPKVRTIGPGATRGRALLRAAPVTMSVIAICVAVFVVLVASGSSFIGTGVSDLQLRLEQISLSVGLRQPDGSVLVLHGIAAGHYWRILTAMFVHFGLIHIGSNMLVLFFIGIPLERRIGSGRFAAVYLVTGIGGGVATYLFAGPTQASAGASGAIFGLLGAYAVLARRYRSAELGSVTGTIVLNLVITFSIPGISITDHLGGLVIGAVLGGVLALEGGLPVRQRARVRALAREGAAIALVLAVLVGLTAYRTAELRSSYGPQASGRALGVSLSVTEAPAVPPPPARG